MTTFDPHKNLAYALVSVAPAPALTGVTLTVAAGFGALFPVAPFNCTVWPPAVAARQSNAEIVRVTARVGDVMTIVRAQEGTTAKAVAVGWQFANTITVKDLTDVENAVNTIETTGVFDGDAANGDLSGTYPNPTLDVIGVATGPIGDGTDVPVVTIDAKGRVTALTSTPITGSPPSGAAGGDLAGTYPNPTLAVIGAATGPVGNATTAAVITIDAKGRVTALTSAAITGVPPGGAAGGDLTGTYPNPGVVLATVLAAGKTRLSVAPALAGDPVAVGDNDPRNTNSRAPSGAAGGDLTGTYPSPTLALIGAATGPIGNGTTVPVVTIDAKGRVTALTSTPITGAPPSGAAGGVLSGTYPNPGFAVDMATQAELDAALLTAVIKLPTTDARNVIQPSSAAVIPLTLKGFASQTKDLLQLQNSAGTVLSRFDEIGRLGVGVDPAFPVDVYQSLTTSTSLGPFAFNAVTDYSSPTSGAPFGMKANHFLFNYNAVLNSANAMDHAVTLLVELAMKVSGSGTTGDNIGGSALNAYGYSDVTNVYPLQDLGGLALIVEHIAPVTIDEIRGAEIVAGLSGTANGYASNAGIPVEVIEAKIGTGFHYAGITAPLWKTVRASIPYLGSATSRITEYRGISVEPYPVTSGGPGSGSIVDWYGIRVTNPTTTISGLRYSIYTDTGEVRFNTGAATRKGLVVKGFAAQSANLFETQDSAGNILVDISSAGILQFGSASDTNLYRSAADTLKTDDSLIVGATLSHLGSSLGFLNAAPVAQQAASAISTLWTALKNYGLLTAGSTPPSVGTGTVTSVTATDGSIVVTGTATDPTIATGALNAIATAHPPVAAVALNAQKITGLADGSAASDAAAFGQIATGLATAVILTPTTDARNVIQPSAATVTPLTVKGFAAQTDPLQEWTDSTPTTLLSVLAGGAVEMLEQTVPATPGANRVRMFSRDSGGGLTQIVAVFPSGNTVVIAEDF